MLEPATRTSAHWLLVTDSRETPLLRQAQQTVGSLPSGGDAGSALGGPHLKRSRFLKELATRVRAQEPASPLSREPE